MFKRRRRKKKILSVFRTFPSSENNRRGRGSDLHTDLSLLHLKVSLESQIKNKTKEQHRGRERRATDECECERERNDRTLLLSVQSGFTLTHSHTLWRMCCSVKSETSLMKQRLGYRV